MKMKSKAEIIDVVIASDQNYFVGLRVTFLSLLMTNRHYTYRFHVLDGGIDKKSLRAFEHSIKTLSPDSQMIVHLINQEMFRSFPELSGSLMAYARLLIPQLVSSKKALYLDCDMLVLGNIDELWNTEIDSYYLAAVQDSECRELKNDCPHDDPPEGKYFNSGMLLMNLEKWREENISDILIKRLSENPCVYRFYDQTVLNEMLYSSVKFVNEKYNFPADNYTFSVDKPVILHFLSRHNKPWNCYSYNDAMRLWNLFFRYHVERFCGQWREIYGRKNYLRSSKDSLVMSHILFMRVNRLYLLLKAKLGIEQKATVQARLNNYTNTYESRRISKNTPNGELRRFIQATFSDKPKSDG